MKIGRESKAKKTKLKDEQESRVSRDLEGKLNTRRRAR